MIASELASDGVSVGPPGASDTVRRLMESSGVVCADVRPDEYNRFIGTYSIQEDDPWTSTKQRSNDNADLSEW